jgi:sucrose phosphorylase
LHLPQFTASHDGIGVRPLEGLVPEGGLELLVRQVEKQGGRISSKRNPDGSESPYELNITYFDALGGTESDLHITRFLCSQTLPLSLQGIPALYFQSLVAAPNDTAGLHRTGAARSLNRHKWQEAELHSLLHQSTSPAARVCSELLRRLRLRADQAAFDPASPQQIHALHPQVFTVERGQDASRLLALHHLCDTTVEVALDTRSGPWRDLLDPSASALVGPTVTLGPYACRWLVPAL